MDQRAAEFAAQLMATFKVEAQEHLKGLTDGLLALEGGPPAEQRQELVETIFREAHSLKGAARAVDLVAVQDVCQSLENMLSELKQGKMEFSPELFDKLYGIVDLIEQKLRDPNREIVLEKAPPVKLKEEGKVCEPSPPLANDVTAEKHAPASEAIERPSSKTVRVNSGKLDALMQEVEEMLIVKLTAGQRYTQLMDIERGLSLWEKKWMRVQHELRNLRMAREGSEHGYVPTKEFLEFVEAQPIKLKEVRENIQCLVKAASQDTRLTASMVDGLLEDTKKVLMQPFTSLFEQFPKMVRDISHSLSKKINLSVEGGDIEVDRRILEEMKDPLIHLLRNSIDHGIELPEERQKSGKNPQGSIVLSATQKSGNQVEICIMDDGKGINIAGVKNMALKNGLITQKEAQEISDHDAIMLIFKSGLSTSAIITELSGRGLGLGIVLEKVEKLGGQLNVESKAGQGTTFKITLPLTLATFRGVHVVAAGHDFIFPTHNLVRVVRLTEADINTAEGKEIVNINGRILSYVHLSRLLELPSIDKQAEKGAYLPVMIIRAMDVTVAIGVDQILNEQQVFIKGLGKQLLRVRNIAAATVMEWGKVIPILDPFDLVKSVSSVSGRSVVAKTPAENKGQQKTVLVAEDSVTARVLLKNILESAGFKVIAAVDGQEAFSILKVEDVDLLLSDVEMPRMDGFKLTASTRALEKFKDLPIVLCTSRASREDREHGIEVGANAYIDKSSFTQSYLLEIIQKFF